MNAQSKIEVAINVHHKLSTARRKFHSLKLEKTGENKFAGYKYFELGDFLIPALTVFDEVGLGATVSFTADLATMTIRDLDNPADTLAVTSPMGSAALKGCHEVQNIGAVETYQRRYLWVAALEIVEHDALDATTGKIAPEKAAVYRLPPALEPIAFATPEQVAAITALCPKADRTIQGIVEAHKLSALEELTETQATKAIARLNELAREPANA